ncbi:MAG: pyridoxal phosphate-dependent aminotransferase [Thermoflexales bacterium]|nr:pyridoxal phosphate-dependent aminotransferase [Thermoflexales bacterium]
MSGFLHGADLSENALSRARRAASDYVDLTSSNPTKQGLIFPPEILREAAEAYWRVRRYEPDPRGSLAAREAICAYYAQRQPPLVLSPDQVFLTASTSEAYSLLFALLADPGDVMLGPNVTYPLFELLGSAHHVKLRTYRLCEEIGWAIDEDSLLAAANARTRAVLLISPHNPTGLTVQQPLAALDKLGLPVICDEVFAEFTYAISHTPPLGALHPDLPVFTLNGISKMFALPDLKLGWIALNKPAAEQFGTRLEMLNDLYLSANALTQAMLPALFERGGSFVAHMRERVRSALDLAIAMLRSDSRFQISTPQGGYYLFPRVQVEEDEEALVLRLLQQGVLVHPGHFYDCEDGVHLTISCLVKPDRLAEGLSRLLGAL